MTPEQALEVLNALGPEANLFDLKAQIDEHCKPEGFDILYDPKTGYPIALLYEWMLAFNWETRSALAADADPRLMQLTSVTESTLEITATMLKGGGSITTRELMPQTFDVPALQLEGKVSELAALVGSVSSLVSKTELLSGRATDRAETLEGLFKGLDNRALIQELQRLETKEIEHVESE
jgi:hypothetical protein